ncbi:KamA family radical SAM protein [Frigoriflavimonas asaccharolytica]|uniref:Lysine 2,3-aminomutase n=1 Tax=Frigoriflavimonas asaccharolytica TaxID=2735899 RepID=A0A8J8K559_9FLAO|nr:radical SAM protein [Frigoriflavimonas asaccharolytica]NRS92460.1 lysine 2,3-aminomutase [Frigoriflavimonas asaccharolytica]
MREKTTPFLRNLLENTSISKQYLIAEQPEDIENNYNDPLMEDKHEVVKGLIHKYKNRALVKVSYQCAAHCRFCTRIRQIGNPEGTLKSDEIDNIVEYLINHPEIDDVILSGGDPLYTPKLTYEILLKIKEIESIKVIRIGTRMPFQSPKSFESPVFLELFNLIKTIQLTKPFYILVHIEHPAEIVPESIAAIKILKELNVTLLSQTVFLKDINDDEVVLEKMFKKLYYLGVMPYYLYHCDNVKGLEHFIVQKEKEKEIAQKLRTLLSGIATPLLVEDLENGYGKIPI